MRAGMKGLNEGAATHCQIHINFLSTTDLLLCLVNAMGFFEHETDSSPLETIIFP